MGAILQEIPYYSGAMYTQGSIAYVEQEPVVLSTSIRLNILFGRDFDSERYVLALRAS